MSEFVPYDWLIPNITGSQWLTDTLKRTPFETQNDGPHGCPIDPSNPRYGIDRDDSSATTVIHLQAAPSSFNEDHPAQSRLHKSILLWLRQPKVPTSQATEIISKLMMVPPYNHILYRPDIVTDTSMFDLIVTETHEGADIASYYDHFTLVWWWSRLNFLSHIVLKIQNFGMYAEALGCDWHCHNGWDDETARCGRGAFTDLTGTTKLLRNSKVIVECIQPGKKHTQKLRN